MIGMPAPARPFTGGLPAFVTSQPVDRPGNNSIRYGLMVIPFFRGRVVQTKPRQIGPGSIGIMMRNRLVRCFGAVLQQRIDDGHPRSMGQYLGNVQIFAEAQDDADRVSLMKRPEPAFPLAIPGHLRDSPKPRPGSAYPMCLFANGKYHQWSCSVPKKLWRGVARACANAVSPARTPLVGTLRRPVPGTW
jgi:hypothetical protein